MKATFAFIKREVDVVLCLCSRAEAVEGEQVARPAELLKVEGPVEVDRKW